ncbi:MAG: phosphoribosylamine--glycine ligase [Muribaculaceae bacterium]|nr:phosphoribosylamine--glycine ligase [Muribaculaceae bacterium]
MNILLLGSGGREAAIAWKISQSPLCDNLFIGPGNGGTDSFGTNVNLKPTDFPAIETFCRENDINLIIVGNEDPLVAGIRDYFAEKMPEMLLVGPAADGAALEGSKDFAKQFMQRHGIPTAAYQSFTSATVEEGCRFLETLKAPYVLKADGLAAGKGVLIISDLKEAQNSLREMLGGMFGRASSTVVIEEFLSGIECSVFVLTDGHGEYRILPVAKDYKRIGEGDTGLNTGGMGAVSPVPFANKEFMSKVEERIVKPTVNGLIKDGIDYRGFIFLGLINVCGEPMVIEYNVRMGDPETEAVMPRIESDLLPLLIAVSKGNLGNLELKEDPRTAVTVMAVSGGYPGSYEKGKPMTGLENVTESLLFHAGTAKTDDGRLVTSGGRVIAATSYGEDIPSAAAKSFAAVKAIDFDGKYFRRDIAADLC